MEPRSGTHRKIKPRCIVNYSTSRRPAIDAYETNANPSGKQLDCLVSGDSITSTSSKSGGRIHKEFV
jgi:hypothetical protein